MLTKSTYSDIVYIQTVLLRIVHFRAYLSDRNVVCCGTKLVADRPLRQNVNLLIAVFLMEYLKKVNEIIGIVFFLCYAYQFFYIVVPYIFKPKKHKKIVEHKYAVLISARNEHAVIAQLIDSIGAQTYPSELVNTFVLADNCDDDTAEIAARHGATVYERFNTEKVGKGYALEYLLERIHEDYPADAFDAFIVFDADNVIDPNYITEINKTFCDGYKIITSYRNSKNYGDNWISSGYALWFLRESKYLNNSRMLLNTSCAVSGTGFLFSREILEKNHGWHFHLLTEDIEFTINSVVNGEKIGYCKDAMLYDEQPTKFSQSWNQRMRWAKGYLQVFARYGGSLIKGLFTGKSFACFDMVMTIMPAIVLTVVTILLNIPPLFLAPIITKRIVFEALSPILVMLLWCYGTMFVIGIITVISEWKKIHTTSIRKILFLFTFPLFMMTYIPISFVALFKKVEWKHIEHDKSLTLDDINK